MRYALTTVSLPALSVEETVAFAARLGYEGLEWRVRRIPPQAHGQPYSFWGNHKADLSPDTIEALAPRLQQLCAEHGLAIPAFASNARADHLDDIRRLAEGAARCGCPLVRLATPHPYDGTRSYRDLYAATVDALRPAIDVLQQVGVRGLLEIHGGTILPSAGLAVRVVSPFSPAAIGVIYDLNNMVREGYEGLRLGLDVLGPYLAHVHIGGHAPHPAARAADGTRQWRWEACDLQDGLLSPPDLLAELGRVGYAGYITVEDLRDEVAAEDKFGAAIRYLRALTPRQP